jgi:hypothetical protein
MNSPADLRPVSKESSTNNNSDNFFVFSGLPTLKTGNNQKRFFNIPKNCNISP